MKAGNGAFFEKRLLTRRSENPTPLDEFYHSLIGKVLHALPETGKLLNRAKGIKTLVDGFTSASTKDLKKELANYLECFRLDRANGNDLDQAIALICEAASRTLSLRPYRVQIAGVLSLMKGQVAEMSTGEGKTLVVAMSAILQGWRGKGCHVVTANDYLANRDAELMAPLFAFCGLRGAALKPEQSREERKEAYLADITYGTSRDFAADYLRDKLSQPRSRKARLVQEIGAPETCRLKLQRGLACAIVDEADSVLIDGSVTPLIISGPAKSSERPETYAQVAEVAGRLEEADYSVEHRFNEIRLTQQGEEKIESLWQAGSLVGSSLRRVRELIIQALQAIYFFEKDRQYIVHDGKVVIIDEATGRPVPNRSWRDGMHQAIEAKEGLEVRLQSETYARISFQKFFQLYDRLSGCTGTAIESRSEFWQVYDLKVTRIPPNLPCVREKFPMQVFDALGDKDEAIVKEVTKCYLNKQPVLLGTWSISSSERLSSLLEEKNLEHSVLNAKNLPLEASIVENAGKSGAITIATNMAGRGTDIRLEKTAKDVGGLRVILSESYGCSRVDRQLIGRCARQGDPGGSRIYVSMDDEIFTKNLVPLIRKISSFAPSFLNPFMGWISLSVCQYRVTSHLRSQRKFLMEADAQIDKTLSFSWKK